LQIQFLLIDVMIMGLKLSPSNTNKYITGTLNKGANGGKRVVFRVEHGVGEGEGESRGREGEGEGEREGRRKRKGK
jgi:hypothetical protein